MKSNTADRYPSELRELAIKVFLDNRDNYDSESSAIRVIASNIGCHSNTLRAWIRQYDRDINGDANTKFTTSERLRLQELERENRNLRRSNDILRQALSCIFQEEPNKCGEK
ncbi:IS3 family transposase [[Enterobacter] lignolyticus]|uniref:Transposase IS3/IS911 family protein n=1 Tax=Enterobacter lignolyticus (strain SCF1) TaxID=701347 RepID=E3G1P6_ENTLS|nr:IS3 family transposase [[Enterobacter] lignolyticus]ADO46851.1 transposase IS3/IS911 family protein [[Enterobacter] lignolyticus SCF1]